jgi:hypothetical protein
MIELMERLTELRQQTDALRLYALVDGAQYQTHRGKRLTRQAAFCSLFDGTPDAGLAHAGPWLIDTDQADDAFVEDLATLEKEVPAVSWLISPQELQGLSQLLQLNLDTTMPDGRAAMLRFWDPRVLVNLAEVLSTEQRQEFFGHIHEWHVLHKGKRAWIGRAA